MPTSAELALVGGGKLGEALLSGLLAGGHDAADVVVSERYAERAEYLASTYGVRTAAPGEAVTDARAVIVAVKPADVGAVLTEIATGIGPGQLVVSVAAGVTIDRLERGLADGVAVVRAMPNTAALVGEAMTAIAPGSHAGEAELDAAEQLLGAVGKVVRVTESQLDAVTAMSGSGPAYFFYLVESMIEAGVLLGLPRPLATELIVQSAVGSAVMLRDSGQHPVQLREAVTSPGGTTSAALREFEVHGVRAAIASAIEAAALRGAELGRESRS